MTVYVGLVAEKVDMVQILREYFCFPSSVPFHHCSIIIFNSSTNRRCVILETGGVVK